VLLPPGSGAVELATADRAPIGRWRRLGHVQTFDQFRAAANPTQRLNRSARLLGVGPLAPDGYHRRGAL